MPFGIPDYDAHADLCRFRAKLVLIPELNCPVGDRRPASGVHVHLQRSQCAVAVRERASVRIPSPRSKSIRRGCEFELINDGGWPYDASSRVVRKMTAASTAAFYVDFFFCLVDLYFWRMYVAMNFCGSLLLYK